MPTSFCLSSTMKVLTALLFFLLCTTALCSPGSYSGQDRVHTPSICCLSLISQPIPCKSVIAYFRTSSTCSKPGIIFLTKKNRQICVNPSDAWVQECIRDLDQHA
ncbi:C-C motif chemokine 3-like [Tamandua tetradactyla]|uniref:C-C motif chemokine 3-like n=1 Tax=Tamandua tetradactyla TaxID=48850 RepID=UPI00405390EA